MRVARVQRFDRAGANVEQLYAVAGASLDVDGKREQRTVVAP